ncbi:ABC transporter substrate-binding protein [Georgenia deserti]|uniref:ABC transporter substrate-binding protein n=1 Tax=Georgenia deserti TaxID=2093781 RepID=A0ABW4L8R0_9MICO
MRTTTRRTTTAAAAMAGLALALTACNDDGGGEGAGAGGGGGGDGEQPYVAIISKGFQHQFWQTVNQGAEDAAEELGARMTFDGPDTESDVEQQLQQLQTALSGNPDAVGFAALDSEASIPILTQIDGQGIPVVAFDSGVESDIPVSTVSTDNYAAAAEAAEHMIELTDGSGDVAVVCHDQTSLTGIQRRDGFVETIEEQPDMQVVDVQYGGGDQLQSTNITKSILQANPDLAGIYGCNEGSAIGVVNGVREQNRAEDLAVIGFDSGQGQIDAINEGIMDGAITQDPYQIGYQTVETAVAAINGEEVEETVDTGYFWYDADNMDDDEIARALYE